MQRLKYTRCGPRGEWVPDGELLVDIVIEIAQQKAGYFDEDIQEQVESGRLDPPPPADFLFRGGCTLLVDPLTSRVRYCIVKDIRSNDRLARQRAFLMNGTDRSLRALYFGNVAQHALREPFAFLHRSCRIGGSDMGLLTPPASGVTVRMYRQGLGDCFLLAFPTSSPGQACYVLIDCGVIPGTENPQTIMTDVAKDIEEATGGDIHLLVITHEHWDHVSGFCRPKKSSATYASITSGLPGPKTPPTSWHSTCEPNSTPCAPRCAWH